MNFTELLNSIAGEGGTLLSVNLGKQLVIFLNSEYLDLESESEIRPPSRGAPEPEAEPPHPMPRGSQR